MSKRTARTIRIFSLEVSPNLVLLNIRKVDFHDFGNYWKVTSSQNGPKTFLFVPVFGNTISLKARVSVSQLKPMNFQKDIPNNSFLETSTSREQIRIVRAVLLDTPKPSQFQPRLQLFTFYGISSFSICFRICGRNVRHVDEV